MASVDSACCSGTTQRVDACGFEPRSFYSLHHPDATFTRETVLVCVNKDFQGKLIEQQPACFALTDLSSAVS